MRTAKRACWIGVACLVASTASTAAQAPAPASGGKVAVTVSYKGKGAVDAAHEILVFLFDTPNIAAGVRPLGIRGIQANGGTATFEGVTTKPVYIAVAYDEKDNFDGRSGPPPEGTPIAYYTRAKTPKELVAVEPGPKAAIKMTFDDSRRWSTK